MSLKVLVACEESQEVCKAFRRIGFEAFSNDILDCSGGCPEWHIKGDAIDVLYSQNWDAVIAFPPCTHLAASGAKHFKTKREDGRQQAAIDFFLKFANYDCPYIAIENPVGVISTVYRKPDQIIQPWQFGHGETKATCLWLKGLPKLTPTNIVEGREQKVWRMPPSPERSRLRSKTYTGIAQAMAHQWGNYLASPTNEDICKQLMISLG